MTNIKYMNADRIKNNRKNSTKCLHPIQNSRESHGTRRCQLRRCSANETHREHQLTHVFVSDCSFDLFGAQICVFNVERVDQRQLLPCSLHETVEIQLRMRRDRDGHRPCTMCFPPRSEQPLVSPRGTHREKASRARLDEICVITHAKTGHLRFLQNSLFLSSIFHRCAYKGGHRLENQHGLAYKQVGRACFPSDAN